MSLSKIAKEKNSKKYKEVSKEAWNQAQLRALKGKSKDEPVSYFDMNSKETMKQINSEGFKGSGTTAPIGAALGYAAGRYAANKLHVNEKNKMGLLMASVGGLSGFDVGSKIGMVKGIRKELDRHGIKPSWGISEKQHMTEEAINKFLSDAERKRMLSKKAFNYKTELVTGGLGGLAGYKSVDGSTKDKLRGALGGSIAGASAGHIGKHTMFGDGFRFTVGGGGGRAGRAAGTANPGHYESFFNGVSDPAKAKKMFRAEARKVHPDLHGADKKEWAQKRQQELNAAYEMFVNKYGRK